jgi:hypothetical protein
LLFFGSLVHAGDAFTKPRSNAGLSFNYRLHASYTVAGFRFLWRELGDITPLAGLRHCKRQVGGLVDESGRPILLE